MDWFIKKVLSNVRNDEDDFTDIFYFHNRVTLLKKIPLSNLTTYRNGSFLEGDATR